MLKTSKQSSVSSFIHSFSCPECTTQDKSLCMYVCMFISLQPIWLNSTSIQLNKNIQHTNIESE